MYVYIYYINILVKHTHPHISMHAYIDYVKNASTPAHVYTYIYIIS